jgi:Tol biopolymer transport system component
MATDGRQIAFSSMRAGGAGIFLKAANGAGSEKPIVPSVSSLATYDWSRDGRYILHLGIGSNTGPDLWVYDLKEEKISPIVQTQFNESQGQFSPDGLWVAYSSDASARYEVYVRSFAGPPSQFQISANGGGQPRWRGNGKELYYVSPDGKMIAVTVKAGADSFEREAPRVYLNRGHWWVPSAVVPRDTFTTSLAMASVFSSSTARRRTITSR